MAKFPKKIIDIPKRLLVDEPLHLYSGLRGMFRGSSNTVGLPPGQALYRGPVLDQDFRLYAFCYNQGELVEFDNVKISELPILQENHQFLWVNVDGIHHAEKVKELCDTFSIHPLTLEDILTTDQRPKLEDTDQYLFASLKMLQFDQEYHKTIAEQVSFILKENIVFTFQEKEGDTFEGVRNRLRAGKGRIRKEGSDYLFYALIDNVVDHYFTVLEKFGDLLEDMEERIMLRTDRRDFNKLYELRREMILIRRSVWPLREVISRLEREELRFIKKSTRLFIRDVYDHTIQAIDSVETYRDFISSLGDLYQSMIGNKLNEIMKTLTIISVIFIPMTFIAGVYGINFENVPEFSWDYGYAYFWALIVGILVSTLAIFKLKHWL